MTADFHLQMLGKLMSHYATVYHPNRITEVSLLRMIHERMFSNMAKIILPSELDIIQTGHKQILKAFFKSMMQTLKLCLR